eukprot:TRINITY_DN40630_c0_g1_i1.p1 TRINITY_DN40630_c0_g1~~TRINITY_DN40630_c0_g1_i1.p1  ORF type:complete len:490 (+),score=37.62 TRINITY_DN40630_c0_g1_i1:256-1725(+)
MLIGRRSPSDEWIGANIIPEADDEGEDGDSPASPTTSERAPIWKHGRSLDDVMALYIDSDLNADDATYGDRPITTGLRFARWQLLVHISGWASLALAWFTLLDYATGKHSEVALCSDYLGSLTRALLTVTFATLDGISAVGLPILIRMRRIRAGAARRILGLGACAHAIPNLVVAVHLSLLILPLEDKEFECSGMAVLAIFCRSYITTAAGIHKAYTFLHNEAGFLATMSAASVAALASSLTDLMLGVADVGQQLSAWLFGLPCLLVIVTSHCRRLSRVMEARQRILEDEEAYNEVWNIIAQREDDNISRLDRLSGAIEEEAAHCGVLRQFVGCLDHLYADALDAQLSFASLLSDIAARSGGQFIQCPVKRPERVFQKLRRTYHGDCSRLFDLVRCSIVYGNSSGIEEGLELLRKETRIRRIKNRLHHDYDASISSGYRDLHVNIDMRCGEDRQPHICEVQLHHKRLYRVTTLDGCHQRYVDYRNLRGS